MGLSARDRRIARLAVPALGTLAVEPLYVLVDTAIVGRLGTVPLGGLAVAAAVLGTVLPVCNFLAYGTTARVAFLTGRGDRRAAASVAAQGLWLSALIGVPMAVLLAATTGPVVALMGGRDEIAEAARTYLLISCVGIPAVLVALVGHGYLRGVADTRTPLLIALAANVLNVVLEIVLVYGFDLGVAGSAWGTVVAQVGAAAWFVVLLRRRLTAADAPLGVVPAEVRRLLLAGRHLFVRTASLLATLAIATAVAARIGAASLGGHQIALQVHVFIALALDALAIPGQVLVGTLLGAGDRAEARATSNRLLQLGVIGGVLVAIALLVSAPFLPKLFTNDADVVDRARIALSVAAFVQLPGAVAFVLDGVLIGASDFRYLQRSMVVGLLVFLPFAVVVPAVPSLGVAGVWLGLLAWMVARAVANVARYRREAWLSVST